MFHSLRSVGHHSRHLALMTIGPKYSTLCGKPYNAEYSKHELCSLSGPSPENPGHQLHHCPMQRSCVETSGLGEVLRWTFRCGQNSDCQSSIVLLLRGFYLTTHTHISRQYVGYKTSIAPGDASRILSYERVKLCQWWIPSCVIWTSRWHKDLRLRQTVKEV